MRGANWGSLGRSLIKTEPSDALSYVQTPVPAVRQTQILETPHTIADESTKYPAGPLGLLFGGPMTQKVELKRERSTTSGGDNGDTSRRAQYESVLKTLELPPIASKVLWDVISHQKLNRLPFLAAWVRAFAIISESDSNLQVRSHVPTDASVTIADMSRQGVTCVVLSDSTAAMPAFIASEALRSIEVQSIGIGSIMLLRGPPIFYTNQRPWMVLDSSHIQDIIHPHKNLHQQAIPPDDITGLGLHTTLNETMNLDFCSPSVLRTDVRSGMKSRFIPGPRVDLVDSWSHETLGQDNWSKSDDLFDDQKPEQQGVGETTTEQTVEQSISYIAPALAHSSTDLSPSSDDDNDWNLEF